MTRYGPRKHAHRALKHLAAEPDVFPGIAEAGPVLGRAHRRKLWMAVSALVADGLVVSRGGLYSITDEGRDALTQLNAGSPVRVGEPATSVRMFAKDTPT